MSLFGITANQKGEIQISEAGLSCIDMGNSFDVVIAGCLLHYVVISKMFRISMIAQYSYLPMLVLAHLAYCEKALAKFLMS